MVITEFIIVLYIKTFLSWDISWTASDILERNALDTKLNFYKAQLIQQILIWTEVSTRYIDLQNTTTCVIQVLGFKAKSATFANT